MNVNGDEDEDKINGIETTEILVGIDTTLLSVLIAKGGIIPSTIPLQNEGIAMHCVLIALLFMWKKMTHSLKGWNTVADEKMGSAF